MAASPHVLVRDGSGPFINPDNTGNPNYPAGANVTPSNVISIKLSSADSVSQWNLKVLGTDEDTVTPALSGVSPTGVVSTPTTVVTFTIPSGIAGRTYIFQSMVNNGGPPYTTTFGIYTLTSGGFRVGAVGERFENDPVFGWTRTINKFIKNGGGGGGGSGIATSLQTASTIVSISGATAPSAGQVLTAVNSTSANWETPSSSSSTPLSSVFYVDKNTTVPAPSRNGSQATPFSTVTAGLVAAASGGTIYLVPENYTSEGTLSLTQIFNLIGMDTIPVGSAQSEGLQIPRTIVGSLAIASGRFSNLVGMTISAISLADNTSGVAFSDCSIGSVTGGVSNGSITAASSLISNNVNTSSIDAYNCVISGTSITVTEGGVANFWGCFFYPGITVTFSGTPGVVQVDRETHHSWVKNGVTLVNGTLSVISGPLQVWKNGTPVGANVGVLNILSDPATAVTYTPPAVGEDFGTIALTINTSGVWSLTGNLGSDEVSPTEIYPTDGIRFDFSLDPALGIGLQDTNGVKCIRIPLALIGVVSTKIISSGAVIHSCMVNVTTPYSTGTTITVGRSGSLALIQGATDNDTSTAGLYNVVQDTSWGGADEAVVVTIHNTDLITTGSGFCTVLYSVPAT